MMKKINIATTSTRNRPDAKLLVIHAESETSSAVSPRHLPINYFDRTDLIDQFKAGDVIVANGAATLPASFQGTHANSGTKIELRLAQNLNRSIEEYARWRGVIFGEGDWRLPTEDRTEIAPVSIGDQLVFSHGLEAEITAVSDKSGRLVDIKFLSAEADLLNQFYQAGRLIQYSYHQDALDLWDGQTIFAGKPIALEAPSASFPLTWETMMRLQEIGAQAVYLFHAAGISSTGDAELDKLLPLPEPYEIPKATAEIINKAKKEQRRIIALGTSVTRALESAALEDQTVQAGRGIATLRLSPTYERKVVSGLLSGMHEDGASHLELLQSFAPEKLINTAYHHAKKLGYLWHEYGDSCLIFS